MSKPLDLSGHPGSGPSRNIFVRFQKGFERGFNRFRERYGLLLEQAIARRSAFVTVSLAIAVASLSLFFFLGRDFFPEIRSGVIQMHMRAPLGTRIEVSGRIATLVSNSVEELLAGHAGAALGLSIVKHLVDLMQGAIEVSSELDRGTSMRIVLPLIEPGNRASTPRHLVLQVDQAID